MYNGITAKFSVLLNEIVSTFFLYDVTCKYLSSPNELVFMCHCVIEV